MLSSSLYERWLVVTGERPGLRAVEQAAALGVSEAELVAMRCGAGAGVALRCEPAGLLRRLRSVGTVMGLTRNPYAVLESVGVYADARFDDEHAGLVVGPGIDLRVFPRAWSWAFAVEDRTEDGGTRRSLQFFGSDGVAVHKIYERADFERGAYDRIVADFARAGPPERIVVTRPESAAEAADAAVDAGAYREALAAMSDTHDFVLLLRTFGLRREQGLRLAGRAFAVPVARDAYRSLFAQAHRAELPLMLFVASDGVVQIFTGTIPSPIVRGPWYNLMQPDFNLHLREDGIARAWVVRKPTRHGVVTSLELYDDAGELVLQVFGERHSDEPENERWRALALQSEAG